MHPAVSVTAGFFFILILQRQQGAALVVLALAALLLGACCARKVWWRTLRRLRYIFLALLLLFLWDTPGRLLWPALGNFSPSVEGVLRFGEQAMHLAGAVSVVALLLAFLDPAAWVSSLAVLLAPLTHLGFPVERFVVRLRLVLEYVAQRELDWRAVLRGDGLDALDPAPLPEPGAGDVVRMLTMRDRCLIAGICVLACGVLIWQG